MSNRVSKSCSTFIAPADILPEAVRDLAGAHGICCVQIVRPLDEEESIVRVSALHLLVSPQSYVIILEREALDRCLPCRSTIAYGTAAQAHRAAGRGRG